MNGLYNSHSAAGGCIPIASFSVHKLSHVPVPYEMATDARIESALRNICGGLGYSQLRDEQRKAVSSFIRGNNVFVVLPTGSGKTLCFATIPWLFDELYHREGSIVIVVSPLTALMKDQVHI